MTTNVIRTKRRRDRVLARVVPIVVRFGLLVASALSILTVWLLLRGHDIVINDPIDNRLIVAMGAGFALAAVVMLCFTPEWSLRGVGQMWTYVGDALFWGAIGAGRVGWRHQMTPDELQVIRAVFLVATVALIGGIVWWLVMRVRAWWKRGQGWDGTERRDPKLPNGRRVTDAR